MRQFTCITFLLLIAISYQMVNAERCPPGQYYNAVPREKGCFPCLRGYYCPGDDQYYECKNGTVAPTNSMLKCDKCPSNTYAWRTRTFCVPLDTPQYALDFDGYSYQNISAFPVHFVGELRFDSLVKYISIALGQNMEAMVAAYASTTGTGNPSYQNHQFASKGNNNTLIIPRPKGPLDQQIYQPIFMTLESNTNKLGLTPYVDNIMLDPVVLNEFIVTFSLPSSGVTNNGDVLQFFTIPNIKYPSKVSLHMTAKFDNPDMVGDFTLLVAYDKLQVYPNECNYEIKAPFYFAGQGSYGTLPVTFNVMQPRDVYLSVLTTGGEDMTIEVVTQVSKP